MKRVAPPLVFSLVAPLLASCSHEAPPAPPAPPPATAPAAAPVPRPAFENPGGMWMPEQLADHAATLKSLGLEIDPAQLTDPTSPLLSAIVSLGGCSASFVSSEGLIITNHHCVQGALQYNSTPENNLIKNGFLAKGRGDEKWNGPTARVFVTRAISDVTAKVLDGATGVADDRARFKRIEARQKALVTACENGRPGTRCTVAKYFDGAKFYQIEQLELRDVRLVYAPDAGVGNFGGEVDNWRWPRQAGDFSFYRAYVGKDGKPADHADDNVPYKPASFLKLASKPLAAGDLVFVAGYPGRTNRLKTAGEVKAAVEWFYPRRVSSFEAFLALLDRLGKADNEVAIKSTTTVRGLNNYLTNTRGQLDGLVKGGLLDKRARDEAELRQWLLSGKGPGKAGLDAIDKIDAIDASEVTWREKDATMNELVQFGKLFGAAMTIVRMAEERPKPDAERDPDYQERNWKRLEQAQVALDRQYNRTMDRELFALVLKRALALPEAARAEVLPALVKRPAMATVSKPRAGSAADSSPHIEPSTQAMAAVDKASDGLYAGTKLEDGKLRVKLLQTATTADLKKSADPMIKFALEVRPFYKAMQERDEARQGALALVRPAYIAALQARSATPISPDANGTLRITYGTVRGYRPAPEAPVYTPFTTLSSMVAKATGQEPFAAPARVLAAANAKKYGAYADKTLGDVPVDFLADLHITGGNSGSATLNARGELAGLVFDGNYEAMASDWFFQPSITRSIHVDLRYIEWVMDAADGADGLLREMGGTPSVD